MGGFDGQSQLRGLDRVEAVDAATLKVFGFGGESLPRVAVEVGEAVSGQAVVLSKLVAESSSAAKELIMILTPEVVDLPK